MANNRNENPGNFANDRQRASEAGQKGGQSHTSPSRSGNDSDRSMNAGSGSRSGSNSGNFAQDHDRAVEAGRKGGQNSHGGNRNH